MGGPIWNEGDSELLGNYFMFMFLASSVISGRFVEYQPIIHIYIYIVRCPKLRCCSSITCCAPIQRDDLWWFTNGTNGYILLKNHVAAWKILNEWVDVSHKKWGLKAASLVHQMDSHCFCLPNLCYYSPVFFTWIPVPCDSPQKKKYFEWVIDGIISPKH